MRKSTNCRQAAKCSRCCHWRSPASRARGICVVIDNDADNLYITVTAKAMNPKLRIITRAGQQRYAQAMRNSGADEVIIPEHEGGLMVGRMIEKYSVV